MPVQGEKEAPFTIKKLKNIRRKLNMPKIEKIMLNSYLTKKMYFNRKKDAVLEIKKQQKIIKRNQKIERLKKPEQKKIENLEQMTVNRKTKLKKP